MADEEEYDRTIVETTNKKKWITCSILLLVNLLNYMDRFTIVGVMTGLKEYFDFSDTLQGLLQTVFIVFYLFAAPLFGYLGDRFNRKLLMMIGITIWILAVFASSFCGRSHYLLFLLFRGIVGIGEASYATIAPTILSDLFHGAARSRVLMMFYFAIPVGSGLGFIAGASIANLTGSWQWGVRFSPIIGIACLALMFWLLEEPVRGACDGARQTGEEASLWSDCKYLLSVKTYCLVSAATVASFFSIGATSWWTKPFMEFAWAVVNDVKKVPESESTKISLICGVITAMAGILGVTTGSLLSRAWRDGKSIFRNNASEKADVYVCALSMFLSLPFLFLSIVLANHSITVSFVLIYFAVMGTCLNWAVNVDVLMYVVVANRRATALAMQTMVAHLFGDAASPYVIGALSDHLRGNNDSMYGHFASLQQALLLPTFMLVIAGALFLIATFYVEEDRKEALYQMDAPDHWNDPNDPEDMSALLPNASGYPATVQGREEQPADIITAMAPSTTSGEGTA